MQTSPEDEFEQPDELTVDDLSGFGLSPDSRDILERARILATFGTRNPPQVSTTCLLFGIAESGQDQSGFGTPQFFWRELQRADENAYKKVFKDRFPHPKLFSSSDVISYDRIDERADIITPNVRQVFLRAEEILRVTALPSSPGPALLPEHLLAALLTSGEVGATRRLAKIIDVTLLRQEFLFYVTNNRSEDDLEAWQSILVPQQAPDATELAAAEPIADEIETDFRAPLAGFLTDYWIGEDLLDITSDVNALASLVSACSVDPPLSIGLFGDWGSGKTHFMKQMKARVEKLSLKARASGLPQNKIGYYKNIVQIEFNAWHYIEGNLWASLVEHIFHNLKLPDQNGSTDVEEQVEDARLALMEKLGLTKELQAKVEARKQDLIAKEGKARGEAEEAKNKRDTSTQELAGLKNVTKSTSQILDDKLQTVEFSDDQRAFLKALGIPGTVHLPAEIHNRYQHVQGYWPKIRAQWNLFRANPRILRTTLWVLGGLLVVALVASGVRRFLPGTFTYVASLVTFVVWLVGVAKPYYQKFQKGMASLKQKYEQIEQERQAKIIQLENDVTRFTEQFKEAENEATAIRKEVADLETQLQETDVSKLLAGFIEDRAACSDYRRHLGVLALIRRNFEKLSDLLSAQRKAQRESGSVKDPKAINRIILYVDDLDRCPPERVVQVLQAIHLLLAFPLFVVVVGVDARWVTRSLQESYEWLTAEEDPEKENREDKKEAEQTQLATPHDYLEKIFQIPFWLKPMQDAACEKFLEGLTRDSRASSQSTQNGGADRKPIPAAGAETQVEAKPLEEANAALVGAAPIPGSATTKALESSAPPAVNAAAPVPIADSVPAASHVAEVPSEIAGNVEVVNLAENLRKEPEKDDDGIELAPQSLTLTDDEINYMKELIPLIKRSPRSVKRFLNCYRLIRVGMRPRELASFLGSKDQPGEFKAVMVLLGVITGAPSVSLYLIEELEKSWHSRKTMTLNEFFLRLEANPEISRKSDWIRVREFLEKHFKARDEQKILASLIKVTQRVSRYSFRVARVEDSQKRKTVVASSTATAQAVTQSETLKSPA